MTPGPHPIDLLALRHRLMSGTDGAIDASARSDESVAYPILADGAEMLARLILLAGAIPLRLLRRNLQRC
jgi:hypothetical protein